MKKKAFIGIDVSKVHLDVAIYQGALVKVSNNQQGFEKLMKWMLEQTGSKPQDIVVCFEHTGHYSRNLWNYLYSQGIITVQVPGLEVKRSLGMSRGKNDQVDARRIASYAYQKKEVLRMTKPPEEVYEKLTRLLSLRDRMASDRGGYLTTLKEHQWVFGKDDTPYTGVIKKQIADLKERIQEIDKQITELITSDKDLSIKNELVQTITGIGPVTAVAMITYTHGFKRFKNWRKFACFIGTAPFENQSGTSINGRTKVSALGNKNLKKLLHLSARSAIVHNPELRSYYRRRVDEDHKSKMSTINIVSNKLLARMFAVINRGTPYVQLNNYEN